MDKEKEDLVSPDFRLFILQKMDIVRKPIEFIEKHKLATQDFFLKKEKYMICI